MVQVAVSVVVLVAAMLFLHSLWNGFQSISASALRTFLSRGLTPRPKAIRGNGVRFSSSNSKTGVQSARCHAASVVAPLPLSIPAVAARFRFRERPVLSMRPAHGRTALF